MCACFSEACREHAAASLLTELTAVFILLTLSLSLLMTWPSCADSWLCLTQDGSTLVRVRIPDEIKHLSSPPQYRTTLHLSHRTVLAHLRAQRGEDGGLLGGSTLDDEDLAVPDHRPHHDPSHVWLLTGHLWDLHDHPGQNLRGTVVSLCSWQIIYINISLSWYQTIYQILVMS